MRASPIILSVSTKVFIVDKVDKVDKKLTPYAVYYVGCDTMDRIRKKFTSGSHNSK